MPKPINMGPTIKLIGNQLADNTRIVILTGKIGNVHIFVDL